MGLTLVRDSAKCVCYHIRSLSRRSVESDFSPVGVETLISLILTHMEINQQPNAKRDLILGTWYLDLLANAKGYLVLQKGDLVLQKEPAWPIPPDMRGEGRIKGWGQRFEFHENGEFTDAYGAECGLDTQFHQWTGKCIWNEEECVLFLRIENYPALSGSHYLKPSEEYRNGEDFHITEIDSQSIQLSPRHADVQLWV